MNREVIARLARESITKQAGFAAGFGRGLRGFGNVFGNAARSFGNSVKNTAAKAKQPGQMAGIGTGVVGSAGLIGGAYNAMAPDYAGQYAGSRDYLDRMKEGINSFEHNKGEDPSQSGLSRLLGSSTHYTEGQRAERAQQLRDQLSSGQLDDRNLLHQAWAMGGYNPLAFGAGRSSGDHKQVMDRAANKINTQPLKGGGVVGILPGNFMSLANAKAHYAGNLGRYGWTAENPHVKDWQGAMPGGLPAMGGTNYPMPLGLPPGLHAPDFISQFYRPHAMNSLQTPQGSLASAEMVTRR